MPKKTTKPKKKTPKESKLPTGQALPQKDLQAVKQNLEKTGEAVGDLFKGLFRGVGKLLDIVGDMEKKGEKVRGYRKEVKGVTKSGKEFRGEAGWQVKTGLLESIPKKTRTKKKK